MRRLLILMVCLPACEPACEVVEAPPVCAPCPTGPACSAMPTGTRSALPPVESSAGPLWMTLDSLTYVMGRRWQNSSALVRFQSRKPGSSTPYHLRYDAGEDHGGCGFYDEVRDGWRTAYCKGTNLGNTSHETRVFLERNEAGTGLRIKIDHFMDEALTARPLGDTSR